MFPDEDTAIARVVMPEGAPDFNGWSDSDKLAYLCASVFTLKSDIAQVKGVAAQVGSQAGPMIEKLSSSPLMKMFGIKG